MKTIYVTVITASFAHQALAMARSVVAMSADAEVVVYALDADTPRLLGPVLPPRCSVVSFDAFADPILHRSRDSMAISAFCWLSKSFALTHAALANPQAAWLCFLDADTMVFADPAERFDAAGERSVVLNPHAFRYDPFRGTEHLYGHFNAGVIAFRNNMQGREILNWWQARCIAHCPATPEPDAFGDQKYLDEMALRFREQVSIGFPYTDCAVWNIGRETVISGADAVTWRGNKIYVFHFQGLQMLQAGWVDLYAGDLRLSRSVRRYLYQPYVTALRRAVRDIRNASPDGPEFERRITAREFAGRCVRTLVAGSHNLMRRP